MQQQVLFLLLSCVHHLHVTSHFHSPTPSAFSYIYAY